MTSYIRHVGRFEWERIVRASRLGGIIAGSGKLGKKGNPTRGGVTGAAFQGVALTFASYGNPDGSKVYPGDAAVAVDCESSIDTVSRVRRAMVELGLLVIVKPDRGRSYWQLSVPEDGHPGYDRLGVLSPAAHQIATRKLREAAKGFKKGGSTGSPHDDTETDEVGGPLDTPSADHPDTEGGSTGPLENTLGGSSGGKKGGPLEALTNPLPCHQLHHANSDEDLRTAVTPSREPLPHEDRNSSVEVKFVAAVVTNPTTSKPRTTAPKRGTCPHGRPRKTRRDGKPRCDQCRDGQPHDTPATGNLADTVTGNLTTPTEHDTASRATAAVIALSPPKCDHGLSAGRRKDCTPICAICRRAERTAA